MVITETFAPLREVPGLVHGFVTRVCGVAVEKTEKAAAVERLWPVWELEMGRMGIDRGSVWTAEQVHGDVVAVVPPPVGGGVGGGVSGLGSTAELSAPPATGCAIGGVDGLVTGVPGQYLGILVADCCAVYLVDVEKRVCGLVHSGKRGTELGIVTVAIGLMEAAFGSRPGAVRAVLSPCIRPPAYEIDFAAVVRQQCAGAGVLPENIHDTGQCTAVRPDRYYSYRKERGRTGRMLALLGFQ